MKLPLLITAFLCLVRSACSQPANINGAYDPAFDGPLSVQTAATGFGATYNELDAAYGLIANGKLSLFLPGNLQNNFNNLNLFIADGRAGQSTLNAVNPGNLGPNSLSVMNGSKFSSGFSATYAFNINNNGSTLTVSQYDLVHNSSVDALGVVATSGGIVANATLDNSVVIGFNNNNRASQAANVGSGSTGIELVIPLSLLGNPTGPIKVLADINGADQGFLSNQFQPGLPAGTANLGAGGTGYGPGGGVFDLSSTSNLYFLVYCTPTLTVNGLNADYGTEHFFLDELSNDAVPLSISFSPNTDNVIEADVFSNLNRRDRATMDANADGVEDGVLPPNGNLFLTGDDSNYYKAYGMTSLGNGQYSLALVATNCGAYRLTARYKVAGDTSWHWYSSDGSAWRGNTSGRRDFAIVASPKKAQSLVLYELNASIVGAQGTSMAQRSTLVDLYNGPGSRPYDPVSNRFNLNYAINLGVNWLWLQPIHPVGIDSSVNSPYSVKNFFAVSPTMSKANNRPSGLQELQGLVAAADAAGMNIMLDVPFNHTARDCELDAKGISYFGSPGNPGNWQPTDEIRNREPRFYSLANNYWLRASSSNSIAIAPDRGDIGKWSDVFDIFYGAYSALVAQSPQNNNNYLSPADTFDYSVATGSFDYVTQNVWRYFSDALLYWLDQTGCTNGLPVARTAVGIDGIRADFAEGLPPQAWEYIINKTRTRKWDFVFLAESLGPTNVTYRSSRDFDVVFDSVLYDFRSASRAADYQSIFDARRTNYGQCQMVWNSASHDVGGYYSDPFQALVRYLVASSIDGAPMIFYGQELGTRQGFGFSVYQNNAEMVPNFLTLNSLQPISAPAGRTYNLDQLYPVYAAAGRARQVSPALRSSNRAYLSALGGAQPSIFSVAKYETPNASPNFSDVVFVFVNLDPANSHQGTFDLNVLQGGTNLFGIKPDRIYNVRNLAAYTGLDTNRPNYWQWNGGIAGSNLLGSGLSTYVNRVPTSSATWAVSPFEAQYLELYDVTTPPTPVAPTTPKPYAADRTVTFSWPAVADPEGGVASYHLIIGTSPGAADIFDGLVNATNLAVTSSFGLTLYARISAINNAGIEGPMSAISSGTVLLDPNSFRLNAAPSGNGVSLTWSTVAGLSYRVLGNTDLTGAFWPLSTNILASGSTAGFLDNTATNPCRFYRVELVP